jgi:hypothetical protein
VITRRGRASASCEAGHAQPDFEPTAIVEVEVAAPLPPIPAIDEQGTPSGNAPIVVRLHFKPLGVVEVSLADGAGSPAPCTAAIWTELGSNINAHLRSDGLPEAQGLSERGLPPGRVLQKGAGLARQVQPAAVVFHGHRQTYELAAQPYWHRIGLSSYLTRCLATRPALIPPSLGRVPRGLAYGFVGSSSRSRQTSAGFPRAWTIAAQASGKRSLERQRSAVSDPS